MILVNNPGSAAYYPFLQHAAWNGLTLADLDFPLFIFIMGVSIPFARRKPVSRLLRRTIILFLLGLLINALSIFSSEPLRIMGVLQRIALCYFFASLIFLFAKPKWQILLVVVIPIVYWLLNFTPAVNLDRLLLSGHLYTTTYDPEGLFSTLPAVTTALIGVLAGELLKSAAKPQEKIARLAFYGIISLVVGGLWNFWFPINKNLWSSSFVVFTGGIALILLATIYYIIDQKGRTGWTKPLIILGTNSIFVYVLSETVNLTLIHLSWKSLIFQNLFSWAGQLNGSLFYALAFLGFCWVLAAALYRKRIFIKV